MVPVDPVPPFRVETHLAPPDATVVVTGEVDLATARELSAAATSATGAGARHVIMDLRPVSFIDSSGLHTLVDINRKLAEDGCTFALIPAAAEVHQTFVITALDQVFTFLGDSEVNSPLSG
jgi:anti-anti-sigma factor